MANAANAPLIRWALLQKVVPGILQGSLSSGSQPRITDHPRLSHQERTQFHFIKSWYLCAPIAVELPSSLCPANREYRHSRSTERFHVAMYSAFRHFQPPGQFAAGKATMRLQQQQHGKQAISAQASSRSYRQSSVYRKKYTVRIMT
jgi:hypothetical protein